MPGPISPPTDLSVECNTSSAMGSFQPPVYGGECVDYYIVSVVSEGRSDLCTNISSSDDLIFDCSVPLNHSVHFTVNSVNSASDGNIYNGSTATVYCK